jgi:hypothetical protein
MDRPIPPARTPSGQWASAMMAGGPSSRSVLRPPRRHGGALPLVPIVPWADWISSRWKPDSHTSRPLSISHGRPRARQAEVPCGEGARNPQDIVDSYPRAGSGSRRPCQGGIPHGDSGGPSRIGLSQPASRIKRPGRVEAPVWPCSPFSGRPKSTSPSALRVPGFRPFGDPAQDPGG